MQKNIPRKCLIGELTGRLDTNMSKITHVYMYPSIKGKGNDAFVSSNFTINSEIVFSELTPEKLLLGSKDDFKSTGANVDVEITDTPIELAAAFSDAASYNAPYDLHIVFVCENPRAEP